MKRIETMTNDEVLEVLNTSCGDCKIKDYCVTSHTNSCCRTKGEWLSEEVSLKQRIATINTGEEYREALEEKFDYCKGKECKDCKYGYSHSKIPSCDEAFLTEMIEVEE